MNAMRVILAVVALAMTFDSAVAENNGDNLQKCLLTSATQEDQINLVRWIFASFSLNPLVSTMSTVSGEQLIEIRQKASDVYIKLIAERCRDESMIVLRSGDTKAFVAAFESLGRVAGMSLSQDPKVLDGIKAVTDLVVNDQRFKAFVQEVKKEAGAGK